MDWHSISAIVISLPFTKRTLNWFLLDPVSGGTAVSETEWDGEEAGPILIPAWQMR